MYQALYRKWRPLTFSDVVGQKHVTDTLRTQVESGRTSHAYLFTGTRGTGKTTCAKILARAVNCENPQHGDPCGECPSCRGILDGSILDVVEIDAASNNGVDNIRDIRDETRYTPATVRKRVYIIDEVHMLSAGAFNALLKTLEEPPAHVLFILATTEINKVPATILSRCQRFDFRRIDASDIAERLAEVATQEQIPLTKSGANMIARLADGALRDALSLLDRTAAGTDGEITEDSVAASVGILAGDRAVELMQCVLRRDLTGAMQQLAECYAAGRELGAVLNQLLSLIRDMLLVQTSNSDVSQLLSPAYPPRTVQELVKGVPSTRLIAYTRMLQEAMAHMPYAANRRIEAELCMVRLCQIGQEDFETLTGRIDALEEEIQTKINQAVQSLPRTAAPAAASAEDAPPPIDDSDAPPPSEEDMPPWEESQAPKRKRATKPKQPPELTSTPKWDEILSKLKGKIPMGTFAQMTFTKGVINGKDLLVVCDDPFTCDLCSSKAVKDAVAAAAQLVTGKSFQIKVIEESRVSALSTQANPVDEIIQRAGQLDIPFEVQD